MLGITKSAEAVKLFQFAPGRVASWATLQRLLPDVRTALFFARAFKMDARLLGDLMGGVFQTPLIAALTQEGAEHSTDLQDYLYDTLPEDDFEAVKGRVNPAVPKGEFLPEFWDAVDLEIADSIQQVAVKLGRVLDSLPSKEGRMTFSHMAELNRQRPTIGTFRARIQHDPIPSTLVVLDVSGSMTESTIRTIVDDVVALSWKANAHLAIVSNSTFVWEPGTYGSDDVLAKAEFGGTVYETLAPLFDRDWGTVITIADYDSSPGAKRLLNKQPGRIGRVLDLSLVDQPTYLAECVGTLADSIEPLMMASRRANLTW